MGRQILTFIYLMMFGCLISGCLYGSTTTPNRTKDINAAGTALGFGAFNMCETLPGSVIESSLKVKLVSAPERFSYSNDGKNSGCTYDGGKDSHGDAVFAWAALVSAKEFTENKKVGADTVKGLGEDAYFVNGADARQLWILLGGGKGAVIAIGDRPNEAAAKEIAAELIRRMPADHK